MLDLIDETPETPEVTDGVDVAFAGARDVSFSYEAAAEGVCRTNTSPIAPIIGLVAGSVL